MAQGRVRPAFQLRGLDRHQIDLGHEMFLTFRLHGVLAALEVHRPSFMCSQKWMNVPWEQQPKSMYDQLVDIITLAPGILETADYIGSLPAHAVPQILLLIIERLVEFDAKLVSFHDDLVAKFEEPLYYEIGPDLPSVLEIDELNNGIDAPSSCDGYLPHPLKFANLEWAIEAMAFCGLMEAYTAFSQLGGLYFLESKFDPDTVKQMASGTRWLMMARRVCQSVDFCTSTSALQTGLGSMRISAPLSIIIDVMKRAGLASGELEWALRARAKIGKRWLRILST
ncbi:hypothetical protein K431DRAFT_346999 [Polychaeton citri CBS 116435]|uniref:Uncharacterized protein n=1 Tax=Polychaeton citri CBS 116435 TaxID=1314669 RepID=A0A9P4UM04_9PEZI|nr:hypothetical protein K431DRAFT_346999 [Polychaeton citri CBS 116435]